MLRRPWSWRCRTCRQSSSSICKLWSLHTRFVLGWTMLGSTFLGVCARNACCSSLRDMLNLILCLPLSFVYFLASSLGLEHTRRTTRGECIGTRGTRTHTHGSLLGYILSSGAACFADLPRHSSFPFIPITEAAVAVSDAITETTAARSARTRSSAVIVATC